MCDYCVSVFHGLSPQDNNDQCDERGNGVHGQILQMRINGTSGDAHGLNVKHTRPIRPSIPVMVRSIVMAYSMADTAVHSMT